VNPSHYQDQVRAIIEGRDWIVVSDAIVVAHRWAKELVELGARRLFLVGTFRGTGPIPVENPHPTCLLNVRATSVMASIRSSIAAFRDLPEDVCAKIDAWDPDHSAQVLSPLWDDDSPIHGRTVFGARWPQWQALENKMLCDSIWDAVGVARAPAQILPVYQAALENGHRELDQGLGTVWAGDNKEGWHGGAEYLRWVRTETDFGATFPFFRSHCDRVRIQAFMEGIPCSIHGMVFPDTVIAFRPCEMLVYRRPGSNRLTYGGAATAWSPPSSDREAMRHTAKLVGAHLREHYGYRGVFTIDGIMTKDGFLPTELNPRYGAAIGRMTSAMKGLPLFLLHRALCEGASLDYRPAELEKLVLETADNTRVIRAGFPVIGESPGDTTVQDYRLGPLGWEKHHEKADAFITFGDSASGAYLTVTIADGVLPRGDSPAAVIAELVRLTDAQFGHGLTDLEPALDVRR
jgi:hypothetical protein